MRQFDCPQCGAPVVFQSASAEAAVCARCQSLVVRRDVNLEAIGKMAVLPPDMSPLQIGARGEIDGLAFTLLGRMRVRWEDGSWNEWFVEYADHTRGWVGEAQGFFMVLREAELKAPVSVAPGDFKAEELVEINGTPYSVTGSKPVSCLGCEGELPAPVETGEKWQSIDLQRGDGCVATLEWSEGVWRFFEGKNASFTELKWQNLRPLPGWNGVPLETRRNETDALNCPSCGGVVSLRAAGFTMTAVCSHCGKLLDTTTPKLKVVQAAAAARDGQAGHSAGPARGVRRRRVGAHRLPAPARSLERLDRISPVQPGPRFPLADGVPGPLDAGRPAPRLPGPCRQSGLPGTPLPDVLPMRPAR